MRAVEDEAPRPASPSEIGARLRVLIGYEAGAGELSEIAALLASLSPPADLADPVFTAPATVYRADAEPEA